MYARSTTIQTEPAAIDAGIAFARDEVIPSVRAVDGCVGISLLVDRQSGRCIFTSAWETEEALRAGIQSTPSFLLGVADGDSVRIVSGLSGAAPYSAFKAEIDSLLTEATRAKGEGQ